MKNQLKHLILLDPSSYHFYGDELFNAESHFNRDNCLAGGIRLRDKLVSQGAAIHTADYFFSQNADLFQETDIEYSSFGCLQDFQKLSALPNFHLNYFFILEPPVVYPLVYKKLPELTQYFKRVYVYNTHGDGYSLRHVCKEKLHQLYFVQPYHQVLLPNWERKDRHHKIVMINGNRRPSFRYHGDRELYSQRIQAMIALSRFNAIDLYGFGWDNKWSRDSCWLTYWLNVHRLLKFYKGHCHSKYSILSQYQFCLCFENMRMDGYITEKIFDCLYAGTIPLYLGAPNISQYVPVEAYVDCRQFDSWEDLWHFIDQLSLVQINKMREAGKTFIEGKQFDPFYNFLETIFMSSIIR